MTALSRKMVLPVSGPFHSTLMLPAAEQFQSAVAACPVSVPEFGVIHNTTLEVATPATIPVELVAHLTSPVRWMETIGRFVSLGITHVIEIGPGSVLTNLVKVAAGPS